MVKVCIRPIPPIPTESLGRQEPTGSVDYLEELIKQSVGILHESRRNLLSEQQGLVKPALGEGRTGQNFCWIREGLVKLSVEGTGISQNFYWNVWDW